jgi:hypothetical protein
VSTEKRAPMECPTCGEITLVYTATVEYLCGFIWRTFDEYECKECHHYETS